nr:PREDICTED: WW domain-binding protein 2-like [Latimeria chalumnae]|eukprot:XP_014344996.1 PREDICTED: WW domain-binding protein 2-like [Latimeria chalumnae]
MAINRNHSEEGGIIVTLQERKLLRFDDVHLSFSDMAAMPMAFRGKKQGILFLTPIRLIFLTATSGPMRSFSMPFSQLRDCQVQQPVLGANYIEGKIVAAKGDDWQGAVSFKLAFNAGGAIDCWTLMKKTMAEQEYAEGSDSNCRPSPPVGPYEGFSPQAYIHPLPANKTEPVAVLEQRLEEICLWITPPDSD